MKSKRLRAIASLIKRDDQVLDIGCDHGYLGIYLKENNLCKEIYLSDINQNALNNALNNLKKRNLKIDCFISNGLKNIDTKNINTVVMSGMGTQTILNILEEKEKLKTIDKLIIQSNNNLDILRKGVNKKGYYLQEEITIFEKDIWYVISLFTKEKKKRTNKELTYGLVKRDKIEYFKYRIQEIDIILKKIPKKHFLLKYKLKKQKSDLTKLLKKCQSIS